jgi:hypothetical protein
MFIMCKEKKLHRFKLAETSVRVLFGMSCNEVFMLCLEKNLRIRIRFGNPDPGRSQLSPKRKQIDFMFEELSVGLEASHGA